MTSQSKRIGENLKVARKAAYLTQEQLAYKAGVAVATVSRLENGRTAYPRPDEFERVAAALGTTTDALMGIDDEPAPVIEDGEPTDEDLDAELSDLTSDTDLVLDFMNAVRDPKKLPRAAKLVLVDDLRKRRARKQARG